MSGWKVANKVGTVAASQVTNTPAGNIASTDVQSAINELDTEKLAVNGPAASVANTPAGTIAATNVQDAINELDGDIQAHISDATDAHDASAISYAGGTGMSATDVEAALDELANEKVDNTGDTVTGQLIIQTTNSEAALGVHPQQFTRAQDTSGGMNFNLRKARGSIASPAISATNDDAGTIFFQQHDGSTFTSVSSIATTLIEPTPGSGAMGARVRHLVTGLGSGSLSEIMRLTQADGISVAGANPVIDMNRVIRRRVYTVGTLPTGAAGHSAFVSDANATTFASVVAGGGANQVPVYHDGTNWRIG